MKAASNDVSSCGNTNVEDQSEAIFAFAAAALTSGSPTSVDYSRGPAPRTPQPSPPPPPAARLDEQQPQSQQPTWPRSFSERPPTKASTPGDDDYITEEKRDRSWSGSFAKFSTDIFSSPLRRIGKTEKPPLLPKSSPQEKTKQEFHDQNRKFLVEAEKQKSRIIAPSTPTRAARSPSPISSFRKRLPSIEENGWNDILAQASVDESDDDNDDIKKDSNCYFHDDSHDVDDDDNDDANDSDSYTIRKRFSHVRVGSDEMSALTNNSWISAVGRRSTMAQSERIAHFEREQQERFNRQKEDIGKKLGNVLGRNLTTEKGKKKFIEEYMEELERERETLLAQWKAELQEEQNRLREPFWVPIYNDLLQPCAHSIASMLATVEVFIANLPLTIGAMGLSWVTMGTVWFKFMEENNTSCIPVHYYSPQCTFSEFHGCFQCDTSLPIYQLALHFHYLCSSVAATCCILFVLKTVLAWRVVADELSNPTTSTPIGVVCVATVCAFAGQGKIGEGIVLVASGFHCIMAFWFLYMAIFRFGLYPDPGWFPNTVGLSYAAAKTWLYFPTPGLFLLVLALIFFFTIFFVSVVRVAVNKKIAAPVCWITLSAPSITLYGFTLISQPYGLKEKALESDATLLHQNHQWMVQFFLPVQHFLMILSLIGLLSAVHGVATRWEAFSKKPFNPAYAAFCFPTLSHANAVQAYRSNVNALSSIPVGSPFKVALYGYWVFWLVLGTILNCVITYMYVRKLPEWTKIDTMGEDEPPAPENTIVNEMLEGTGAHAVIFQRFVSPAVLQANEAGSLIRVRRGTEDYRLYGPYMRTRKVTALGFDPTMDDDELRREHAELLDWVAKNAPRTRNRTMSNPLTILGSRGQDGGRDLYGTFLPNPPRGGAVAGGRRHKRANTSADIPGV